VRRSESFIHKQASSSPSLPPSLPSSLPPSPSNNLNFRLMAIFPAVLAVYGTYQGSKAVTYKLTRRKGRRETIMLLRSFLLSMERMLNLRNVGASEVRTPD